MSKIFIAFNEHIFRVELLNLVFQCFYGLYFAATKVFQRLVNSHCRYSNAVMGGDCRFYPLSLKYRYVRIKFLFIFIVFIGKLDQKTIKLQ